MRREKLLRIAAVAGLAAVLTAACGGNADDNDAASSPARMERPAAPAAAAGPADAASPAAGLRADLTHLLGDHEYLAGITVVQAVGTAPDSPQTKAAAAALDENSKALANAIGSVYGKEAGATFLELWRKHIGFFVNYTVGGVKGDKAAQAKARADLDGYRNDFGAFLASANPNLTKDAVAQALVPHVNSTFAAIDAVVAKDPSAFEKLRQAAGNLPPVAGVLAGAIAKQFPEKVPGAPASPAAGLRADLTHLLGDHEYLAGITVVQAVGTAPDSPQTKAAAAALDENSKALANAIGSVYGKEAGATFLELWRKHIGFFVNYTVGGVKGDKAAQAKARADLDGYRNDFGAFLASANPNLTKDAVAQALVPHVNSTFAAIDAVVAKDPSAFEKLRQAAGNLPPVAGVLAGAIAKQFPEKFSG
jgi:cytochrome c556